MSENNEKVCGEKGNRINMSEFQKITPIFHSSAKTSRKDYLRKTC